MAEQAGEGNEAMAAHAGPNAARPIYAIFEGGGAKGIAHIGALQAIEDEGLEIIGVAGTSAGALVAVLVAIGLESADIMSASDPLDNILRRFGKTPTGLLGASEWKSFERMRQSGVKALKRLAYGGAVFSRVRMPRIMGTLSQDLKSKGHFGTAQIKAFINEILRRRLEEIALVDPTIVVPDQVRFRDLASAAPNVIPLKIIATDIDNGRLEVFDANETGDVIVAEAVAASISIPFAFRPAEMPSFRKGQFADGGLVSNLPIWAFFEEKLAYERQHYDRPPVPVVGFSLVVKPKEGGKDKRASSDPLDYLMKIVNATLDGSQGAARRFIEDLLIVPLDATLTTLDFDATAAKFSAAREAGRVSAQKHLQFNLQVKPDRIQNELRKVRSKTLAEVNRLRKRRGLPQVRNLRVSLIRPYDTHSLRVVESVGMEADADDRLLLDRRGRGAAEVFRKRGLRRIPLGPAHADPKNEFMTKYERALVRSSLRQALCVPIFADGTVWRVSESRRPEPAGVLAIDSDRDLATEFDDRNLRDMVTDQSYMLYAAVKSEMGDG